MLHRYSLQLYKWVRIISNPHYHRQCGRWHCHRVWWSRLNIEQNKRSSCGRAHYWSSVHTAAAWRTLTLGLCSLFWDGRTTRRNTIFTTFNFQWSWWWGGWGRRLSLALPLPALAACERLYSIAGLVFSPKRARLNAVNFENQLLLRINRRFRTS